MDMCPEKERYSRETLSLMNKYEFNNEQVDHRLMVKEYSRSSADQDLPLPNELRPINVLIETMLYLIDEIIPQIVFDNNNNNNDNFSVGDWYDFVWNRTRSIRKDIIQQRLLLNDNNTINNNNNNNTNIIISNNDYLVKNGLGGVIIICARFHIMCAHRLCEQSSNVFDFKINEENLKNCFQSLRQYYEINNTTTLNEQQQQQSASSIPSPNEAEFRSYIILLNLNESNILCEIQRWPDYIRNSKHVKFSLKVYFAYNSKNYVRFFRLIKSNDCEYLQACILHRYFYKVRSDAFKSIFTAFKDQKERTFPLVRLNELLGFGDQDYQEINDYCGEFGLELDESNTNIIMPSILPKVLNYRK
jgi:germinal-center associated nuclear protein